MVVKVIIKVEVVAVTVALLSLFQTVTTEKNSNIVLVYKKKNKYRSFLLIEWY